MYKELPVKGFEATYTVDNRGNVYSLPRLGAYSYKRRLKGSLTKKGYLLVALHEKPKKKSIQVHRLVAEHFVSGGAAGLQVNHKDGNKSHNGADNLEWVTSKQNIRHAWANGLHQSLKGEQHNNAKLTEKQVLEIRALAKTKTRKEIAKIYGVDYTNVCLIITRKAWKHI